MIPNQKMIYYMNYITQLKKLEKNTMIIISKKKSINIWEKYYCS